MKGVARKSSRQEPGDDSDWPPPSLPAAVCWRSGKQNKPCEKMRKPEDVFIQEGLYRFIVQNQNHNQLY